MSRPLRILYPDAWYHVMNRGRRRERLFKDVKDFKAFLILLKESVDLWGVRVAGYCLMTNHYHVLLQTPNANLPRCMRHIDGVYTQRFNRRHRHDGTLFRGRYKSVLIDAKGFLPDVLRYIHRNPMKAGLEDSLGQYPWTSHHAYLSKAKRWAWIHRESVLSILERNPRDHRRTYIDFVSEEVSKETQAFYSKKNLRTILGSSEYLQWIKDSFSDAIFNKEVPVSRSLRSRVEDVIPAVSAVYCVEVEDILTSRRGRENEARDVAILLSRKWTGESLSSLAIRFGLRRHGSIASALSRATVKLKNDRRSKTRVRKAEVLMKIRQPST